MKAERSAWAAARLGRPGDADETNRQVRRHRRRAIRADLRPPSRPCPNYVPTVSLSETHATRFGWREVAGRQRGVVSLAQLHAAGSRNRRSPMGAAGRFTRCIPGFTRSAIPHCLFRPPPRRSPLCRIRAALSHTTAAWLWRLSSGTKPHPSEPAGPSPLTCFCSRPSLAAAQATDPPRFPVTPVARTLRDLASMLPYPHLRRALAEADYLRFLVPPEVERTRSRPPRVDRIQKSPRPPHPSARGHPERPRRALPRPLPGRRDPAPRGQRQGLRPDGRRPLARDRG